MTDLSKLREVFEAIGVPFTEETGWYDISKSEARPGWTSLGFNADESSTFVFDEAGRFVGVESMCRLLPRRER